MSLPEIVMPSSGATAAPRGGAVCTPAIAPICTPFWARGATAVSHLPSYRQLLEVQRCTPARRSALPSSPSAWPVV